MPGVLAAYTGTNLASAIKASPVDALALPDLANGSDTGLSDEDNIIDTLTPTFVGTALPGAKVLLEAALGGYRDKVIGVGVADASGRYSIRANSLSLGTNNLFAAAPPGGSLLTVGSIVQVGATAFDDQPYAVVDVDNNSYLAQTPAIYSASATIGPDNDANDTSLLVYGQGSDQERTLVSIYADGGATPIGTAFQGNGNFAVVTSALSAGPHVLRMTLTLPGGEVIQGGTFNVNVVPASPLAGLVQGAGSLAGSQVYYLGSSNAESGSFAASLDAVGATTSSDGSFALPTSATALNLDGGWDTLTDLPLGGVLALDPQGADRLLAPSGSQQINPLTTLTTTINGFGFTVPMLEASELTALGLDPSINLLTFDPLAAALAGNAAPFLASVKLLDTVSMLTGYRATFQGVFSAIARDISLNGSLDLDKSGDILGVIQSLFPFQTIDLTIAGAIATVVADSNALLDSQAKAAGGSPAFLPVVLANEEVAQTTTAAAVRSEISFVQNQTGESPDDEISELATFTDGLTGASLAGLVQSQLGQSAQVLSFAPDESVTGAETTDFTLTFSAPVSGIVASDFTVDASAGLSGVTIKAVTPVPNSNGTRFDVSVQTGIGRGAIRLAYDGAGALNAQGRPLTGALFESPVFYNAALGAGLLDPVNSIVTGDFNGDGRPDVVAFDFSGDSYGNGVSVFLNQGGGALAQQPGIAVSQFENGPVVTGDFNGDGKLDLLVAGAAPTGAAPSQSALTLLLGDGDGTFQRPVVLAGGAVGKGEMPALAEADFNGDGHADYVTNGGAPDALSVMLSQAADGFGAGAGLILPSGGDVGAIATDDLNGDGRADIVATDATNDSVVVFYNNGDGKFTSGETYATGANSNSPDVNLRTFLKNGAAIALGDVNGDGIPDLILVNALSRSVSVLLGRAGGGFSAAKIFAFPPLPSRSNGELYTALDQFEPLSVSIGDLNNDGYGDLVLGDRYGGSTMVLLSNGDGTFREGESITSAGGNSNSADNSSVIVDLNGDGRNDIVTSGSYLTLGQGTQNQGIDVLLNAPQTVLDASSGSIQVNRAALAQPALSQVSGPGFLTQSGQHYALDLGDVSQGAAAQTLKFALTNVLVELSQDAITGVFETSAAPGFAVAGATLPGALAAGQSYSGLTITTDTSTPGVHTQTITFAPRDQSATVTTYATDTPQSDNVQSTTTSMDGAQVAGELAPLTLTITDNVVQTPAVLSIATVGADPNDAASDAFTVTFTESVSGVSTQDFTIVTTTKPGGATVADAGITSITGSGTTYTVTVGGVTGDGTLGLDLDANSADIVDGSGNAVTAPFTGRTFTVEHTPPVATSIATVGVNPNNAVSDQFIVNFSETVTGVSASDFAVAKTGTVADTGLSVAGTGTTYTVTVSGVTGDGTLGLDLNADSAGVTDTAGNALAVPFTGQTYSIEHTQPVVTAVTAVGASPNNAASDQFLVTFSEAVTGVSPSDFAVAKTGTVADTGMSVSGAGTTYTVTVGGVTGDGTLGLDLDGGGAGITDAAGNAVTAAFTGETYAIEHTPPAPTLTSPSDGSETSDVDPTITGAGVADDTISVSIDGPSRERRRSPPMGLGPSRLGRRSSQAITASSRRNPTPCKTFRRRPRRIDSRSRIRASEPGTST